MFVVQSRFCVANGMENDVRKAFMERPHKVDSEPGFIRMEVLCPKDQPEEFWLITYWQDEQNWQSWYRSHQYHTAHQTIPKGLKLDPAKTQIRYFELVAE